MSRFKVRNEAFQCLSCHSMVPALLGGGCRNHCPYCLTSQHRDIYPGDRESLCHGPMVPIFYEGALPKIILTFQCQKCGYKNRNKMSPDDSLETILKICTIY